MSSHGEHSACDTSGTCQYFLLNISQVGSVSVLTNDLLRKQNYQLNKTLGLRNIQPPDDAFGHTDVPSQGELSALFYRCFKWSLPRILFHSLRDFHCMVPICFQQSTADTWAVKELYRILFKPVLRSSAFYQSRVWETRAGGEGKTPPERVGRISLLAFVFLVTLGDLVLLAALLSDEDILQMRLAAGWILRWWFYSLCHC